ncbi:MAG: hypothetical protein JNM27_20235 [Leptospirales bacterium]|nr:hypothetical protein [Leptospirales bacterium]
MTGPYNAERMNMGRLRPLLFSMTAQKLLLLILRLAFLFPAVLVPQESTEPREMNFGHESRFGRFFPYNELESWATARNLVVLKDCPLREIQDHEAEIIPVEGMEYTLSAPEDHQVFLYLDLVTFRPAAAYNPLLDGIHCIPGEDRVQMESTQVQDVKQVRWLSVEVNGHLLHTAYVGGETFLRSPLVVRIPREYVKRGVIKVRLQVSPGEGFFAIWDSFVSRSPQG